MVSGIEGIMNLAAASGEDLATTSDIVTDALTAFGMGADQSGHFADILAIASSNANTNVAMMGETFKYAAPMMGAMGYSAEDAAIAIGMMANSGIKASSAGTALRAGLVNLAKPTEQMQAAMDKYGISLTDAQGEMLPLRDLMQELREKLGGLSEVEQTAAAGAIFGKNALSGWLAIINGADADLDKLTNSVDNCAGAAQNMANVQLDNLNGDLTLMDSAFDGLKTTIGEQFIPILRELVQFFTDVLGKMDEWVQENPELFKAITATIGALGGLTAGIVAVNGAIKAYQALKAIGLFAGLAGPIGLAVGAVGLLAGGVTYLVSEANKGVTPVKDLTTAIQDMDDTMEESRKTYDDACGSYQATAQMAELYIDKLEELGESNEEGTQHSQEYMDTLYLLSDAIPELSENIDLQTGSIEGGTEALRENTKAWEDNQRQQAEQEYLSSVAEGYNSVMQERLENGRKLIQNQQEQKLAEEKLSRAQMDVARIQDEINGGARNMGTELAKANDKVHECERELGALRKTGNNLEQAIDEDNQALEEQEGIMQQAREAIEAYSDSQQDATDTGNELAGSGDEIVDSVMEVIDSATELSEEYQKAYDSALQSIQGQGSLWEEMKAVTAGTTSEIINNLQSQTDYWSAYNDNLAQLQSRASEIEGLNDVLNDLNDGSEESAKTYATLTNANDEDLQAFVAAWQAREEQQELSAQNIAASQTGMLDDLDGFTKEVQTKIDGMDYSEDAVQAAKDTIQGYIDGLNGQKGPVTTAAREIAQAAIRELSAIPTGKGNGTVSYTGASTWNRSRHNATGSNMAPSGVTLVGENGPELVRLKGGERIVPAPQTADILRSGDGTYASTSLNYSPVYNISGGNAADIRSVLQEHDRDLESRITNILARAARDRERTVYR